jgi:hypothetical protein
LPNPPGFSIPRLYIGEGAMSEAAPGLLTPGWRGQGLGRASPVWGRPVAPVLPLFGCLDAPGKNKTFGFCFVQFWEYFLYSFSEIQK